MIAPLYEWVWRQDHEVWNSLCMDEGCMHCAPLRGRGGVGSCAKPPWGG